jgi:hypothetical protein
MPYDPQTNIFYENQVGGLCRLHALNAYFGSSLISQSDFQLYIAEYDTYVSSRFNIKGTSSSEFDFTNSDQLNIVSFILRKFNIYTKYYAPNELSDAEFSNILDKNTYPFIFLFNADHIYGIKSIGVAVDSNTFQTASQYTKNNWFRVDSMGGVRQLYQSDKCLKNIGVMIPIESTDAQKKEWYDNLNTIKRVFVQNNILVNNRLVPQNLIIYLTQLNKTNKILDTLEVPLGTLMAMLEMRLNKIGTNYGRNHIVDIVRIGNLVDKYNKFLAVLTDGNYNNLQLILLEVPGIFADLLSLC